MGLMRPCGALPSLPFGLSAEVTLAGVSFSPVGLCATASLSRLSRGPPPRSHSAGGAPAPSCFVPPLPFSRSLRSLVSVAPYATLRASVATLPSGRAVAYGGGCCQNPASGFALRPGGRCAPFLAAAPAYGLFQPRSAQPCVSPRLAVHFVHSRTFRCSRPRVPLATASLLSGCAVCQKLVLLSLAFCVLPRFACHLPPCSGNLCPIGHFRCSSGVSGWASRISRSLGLRPRSLSLDSLIPVGALPQSPTLRSAEESEQGVAPP